MRTIIFGGTFDPVHRGHLEIIRQLEERFERVVVIPAGVPPLKRGSGAAHRLAMLKMSTNAEIDTLEIDSTDVSYTYLTLEKYAASTDDLYFCMGGDSLTAILKWKNPQRIMELAKLYVVPRPNADSLEQAAQFLRTMYGADITIADFVGEDISGTEIRVRAAFDDFSLVSGDVAAYIKENNLFSSYGSIAKKLPSYGLSPHRIEHTKNTALTAYKLAAQNFVDTDKAVLAALLHDTGKHIKLKDALDKGYFAPKEYVELDRVPEEVVHSHIGEAIAVKDFGIADKEILNAIRYHATARAGMSQLEKVIFLADAIEPNRNYENVEFLRKKAYEDLESGLIAMLERLLTFLEKQNFTIDKNTIEAYNYYKNEID